MDADEAGCGGGARGPRLPARVSWALDGTNSGSTAAARFTGDFVPGVVETLGDRVNVTVSNIATEGVELGPTFAGDLSFSAMVGGSATGFYGGGFGNLNGQAEGQGVALLWRARWSRIAARVDGPDPGLTFTVRTWVCAKPR